MAHPGSDVLDATGQTVVLAFDLAGARIAKLPDELGKALQMSDQQSAIPLVLSNLPSPNRRVERPPFPAKRPNSSSTTW